MMYICCIKNLVCEPQMMALQTGSINFNFESKVTAGRLRGDNLGLAQLGRSRVS